MRYLAISIAALLLLAGCAEFNPLDLPKKIIEKPLGTDPIHIGMTKDAVRDKWGEPDQINRLESTDQWKMDTEEWVYLGRYTKIPIDKSYIFNTKYLVFDGNNVVCVGDKSKCNVNPGETNIEEQ